MLAAAGLRPVCRHFPHVSLGKTNRCLNPLITSKRCLTSGAGFNLLSWFSTLPPPLVMEKGILYAHSVGGHWTLELLACTAASRILLSTITMTYTRKIFTTYAITTHPVNVQERKVRKEAEQLSAGSLPPALVRDIRLKEVARLRGVSRNLIMEKNIHPGKGFVVMGIESLFWLSYAVGVRNIVAGYPAEWTESARQDMHSQGVGWFTDLTLPDPYCILPLIASCTLIFSVRVSRSYYSCSASEHHSNHAACCCR
jgi:hypothetical protein